MARAGTRNHVGMGPSGEHECHTTSGVPTMASRRGMALLNALFLVAVLTILMVVGIQYVESTSKAASGGEYDAQAYNMARAGLMDTLAWFRRQTPQPVVAFQPVANASDAAGGDTNDPESLDPGGAGVGEPNLGIVREYPLDATSNLYGRYEVGKITRLLRDAKGHLTNYEVFQGPTDDQLASCTLANASSTAYEGVRDVSADAGVDASGAIWRIRSQGYVFRKTKPTSFFFQWPNNVLAQVDLETEIRRLKIADYSAAVVASDCATVTCTDDDHVTLDGNGGQFLIGSDNGTPTPDPANKHTQTRYLPNGTRWNNAVAGQSNWWMSAFGVPDTMTLNGLADLRATQVADLPAALPAEAVIYIKPTSGTITFDGNHPLNGGGVLAVDGNLVIAKCKAKQTWAGMIFVNGNYTQYDDSEVDGEVVVTGQAQFLYANVAKHSQTVVKYSNSVMNTVRQQLENYRESRAALKVIN